MARGDSEDRAQRHAFEERLFRRMVEEWGKEGVDYERKDFAKLATPILIAWELNGWIAGTDALRPDDEELQHVIGDVVSNVDDLSRARLEIPDLDETLEWRLPPDFATFREEWRRAWSVFADEAADLGERLRVLDHLMRLQVHLLAAAWSLAW